MVSVNGGLVFIEQLSVFLLIKNAFACIHHYSIFFQFVISILKQLVVLAWYLYHALFGGTPFPQASYFRRLQQDVIPSSICSDDQYFAFCHLSLIGKLGYFGDNRPEDTIDSVLRNLHRVCNIFRNFRCYESPKEIPLKAKCVVKVTMCQGCNFYIFYGLHAVCKIIESNRLYPQRCCLNQITFATFLGVKLVLVKGSEHTVQHFAVSACFLVGSHRLACSVQSQLLSSSQHELIYLI